MTTLLDKPLRRELVIAGAPYTLTLDPEGFRLVEKGRRNGHALRWEDIVNGDAALAHALYASLATPSPLGTTAKAKRKSLSASPPAAPRRTPLAKSRRPHRRRRAS